MLRVEDVHQTFPPPKGIQRMLIRGASAEPVTVLRGVHVAVNPGEVVGLIGPNGAGKTTLNKIIATLLTPTSGRVLVDGFDTSTDRLEVRRRLGLVLADDRSLYWRMTGLENLEFFAVMSGLSRREARPRAAEMLHRVGLDHRDKLVFGYSSGMKARLSIARALLPEPPLLILDEPTKALDPVATADVGDLLRELAAGGAAVLLASHRMDEIEGICDRVEVMMSGTIAFSGTPGELGGAAGLVDTLRTLLAADDAARGAT